MTTNAEVVEKLSQITIKVIDNEYDIRIGSWSGRCFLDKEKNEVPITNSDVFVGKEAVIKALNENADIERCHSGATLECCSRELDRYRDRLIGTSGRGKK